MLHVIPEQTSGARRTAPLIDRLSAACGPEVVHPLALRLGRLGPDDVRVLLHCRTLGRFIALTLGPGGRARVQPAVVIRVVRHLSPSGGRRVTVDAEILGLVHQRGYAVRALVKIVDARNGLEHRAEHEDN
ncbi:hypothetical protein AB0E64_32490 [Streptomyces caelestis]|uniref:Uncharacterized protein n=1 Tax=Streptomyces caelestis TaxID=36816 RepID=A0A7W9GZ30_9ACTN|nr:hypothetical protein [Streptomyces caelestis]MBB5792710.1 hypothetical protein [Streptomyces caelestis]